MPMPSFLLNMRWLAPAFLAGGLALGSFSARGAGTDAPGAVQHVIHISLDGLGSGFLERYLAERPVQIPTLQRLRAEGASTLNARCDPHVSFTEPNHSSIITGRPVLQQPTNGLPSEPHGFTVNYDPGVPWTLHNFGNSNLAYKASVFDVVHDHGLRTAFFVAKNKLTMLFRSYDANHGAPDLTGDDDGICKIDCYHFTDWASAAQVRQKDADLVTVVLERLSTCTPAYTFLHLADPDITGHYYLWGSPEYREAVLEVDRQLARLLAFVETAPAFSNRTAVIVTSDHGGGDASGAHSIPDDPLVFTIPVLLWGPGVPAGRDLYSLLANRTNPGTRYLDYDAPEQPLRNGDTSNLALALLGLPPIPGSFMVPELKPALSVAVDPAWLKLTWPSTASTYRLEFSDHHPAGGWTQVGQGITYEGGLHTFRMARSEATKTRFFRLARDSAP